MKPIKALGLIAVLAPLSLALASNPASCIKPDMLYQEAASNHIYDVEAAVHDHTLSTHRWYSVGRGEYDHTMQALLNTNRHWENGPLGYEDRQGVLCDYYDKVTNSYVDLQKFHVLPTVIPSSKRGSKV